MTQPSARVILDSLHPDGIARVTTMEVVMHRFVLAEFNTHRVFSRNSASSRAIPLAKQLKRVRTDMAFPVEWPAEKSGMQGGEPLSDDQQLEAIAEWAEAGHLAASSAEGLGKLGVHKSICNRILEPFLWHVVICTATEWTNFWNLRCNPAAQPEMRAAAEAMKAAYDDSEPYRVKYGQWHLPLVDEEDLPEIAHWATRLGLDPFETAKLISAARCARVSYLTHDGKRDWDKDLELANRLAESKHMSPFEHVATPAKTDDLWYRNKRWENLPYVLGNLRGWHQFRHELEGR